jgi:hypothetical protein
MQEIRKMIENGELSLDALKWKVRKDPPFGPVTDFNIHNNLPNGQNMDNLVKDECG